MHKFSFIKVDTEGYDKEILKSIPGLIAEYKPVIVAESFGKATDAEKMELFDVIAQYGYEIFYFEDFDVATKVVKLNRREDIIRWRQTINVYAKPLLQ